MAGSRVSGEHLRILRRTEGGAADGGQAKFLERDDFTSIRHCERSEAIQREAGTRRLWIASSLRSSQ
jgi:hypothetical protein